MCMPMHIQYISMCMPMHIHPYIQKKLSPAYSTIFIQQKGTIGLYLHCN